MQVIRRGITRTVILIGRWAIKVPSLRSYGEGLHGVLWSFSRGLQANHSEWQWCTHAGDDNLCPVRWSLLGGLINVYPRCEPIPVDEQGQAAIDLPARRFLPLGDAKPENFGLLNGRPVWLDYDVSYNGCLHDKGGVQRKLQDLAEDLEAV